MRPVAPSITKCMHASVGMRASICSAGVPAAGAAAASGGGMHARRHVYPVARQRAQGDRVTRRAHHHVDLVHPRLLECCVQPQGALLPGAGMAGRDDGRRDAAAAVGGVRPPRHIRHLRAVVRACDPGACPAHVRCTAAQMCIAEGLLPVDSHSSSRPMYRSALLQAIGLEITSVLAIGGIGGLAIGLAGREICENLLNGFLIMSTNPFEEGDEIHFFHTSKQVEGYVINIGWYRTQVSPLGMCMQGVSASSPTPLPLTFIPVHPSNAARERKISQICSIAADLPSQSMGRIFDQKHGTHALLCNPPTVCQSTRQ
eukprot:361250-Chlamydomonas_euryale.AAC.14